MEMNQNDFSIFDNIDFNDMFFYLIILFFLLSQFNNDIEEKQKILKQENKENYESTTKHDK